MPQHQKKLPPLFFMIVGAICVFFGISFAQMMLQALDQGMNEQGFAFAIAAGLNLAVATVCGKQFIKRHIP